MTSCGRLLVLHVPVEHTPFGEPVRGHQIHLMRAALDGAGWTSAVAEFDPATADERVGHHRPDLILNLCYGWSDDAGDTVVDQPEIADRLGALAELVGSDAAHQRVCQDKLKTAAVADSAGVPTPRDEDPREGPDRPVVIKPRQGAAHRNVRVVSAPVRDDERPGTDEIAQEYVDGPEYSVAVLDGADGPRALTAARIRYGRASDQPRVYDWATTTWEPVSAQRFGLGKTALRLFGALGLRDYARFDFRVDRVRGPVLLDANSLPNLAPRQILATAAHWDGIVYGDLIRSLAESARRRLR